MKSIMISFLLLFCLSLNAQTVVQSMMQTTITDSSTKVLDKDLSRNFLLIENKGGSSVYLKFDSAHSGTEGVEITSGEKYRFDVAPVNAAYLVSDSAASNDVVIFHGVK